MFGKDGIVSVKMNSDDSVVLQAILEHAAYQVFTIVQHGQIYITGTDFWHQALGHSATGYWSNAKDIYADVDILPKRPSHFWCSQCATYNSKEQAHKPVDGPRSKELFDLVHTNVMGPFKVKSMARKKYMISLIDDFTRYAEVNFLFKKSDASRVLQTFCENINTQTKRYPWSFRSDQEGEYINAELTDYFESKDIQHLITTAYSPESNGVAERYDQTLTNIVRPSHDNVPTSLWAEAFNWACYVKNRLPHSALMDETPYEVLFQKKPTISHLHPFYTKCYVHIPEEKWAAASKLDARALEGHFIGYTETTRRFHVYIPSQHKVDTYRQVKFEPSSYTSVDIYTPRPTSNNANQQILPHDHSRPTSPSDQLQYQVT